MDFFKNASNIVIEKRKVINYLLNVAHPDGSSKARLLIRYGFHSENWEEFADCVIAHAQNSKVIAEFETPFGQKIILKGNLETPSGRMLLIKSVWIVSSKSPILVTLFPIKK
jgi:hypothetical protein